MLKSINHLKNETNPKLLALTCDVCNKNQAIGVACIPMIPMSVAYCRICIEANAHPWWVLVANTACMDGLENANDAWKQMVYDTCKHLSKTLEEFNKEVTQEIEQMEKDLEDDAKRKV